MRNILVALPSSIPPFTNARRLPFAIALSLALLLVTAVSADKGWRIKPGGTFQYDRLKIYDDAGDIQLAGLRRARTTLGIKAPGCSSPNT